ncbi:MAG: carbon-nitrogen hydrolase family protein [Acidobacteriota bacterium]
MKRAALALTCLGVLAAAEQPAGWVVWAPRPELAPEASQMQTPGGLTLRLKARGKDSFGKWIGRLGVQPGATYRFEALYRTDQVENEAMSVLAVLSWCKDLNARNPIQRDYVDRVSPAQGGWRKLERTLAAPAGAVSVVVELGLRLTERGSVTWAQPRLTVITPAPRRAARIVTTRVVKYASTVKENRVLLGEILDGAAAHKPDLVLLTETFLERGTSESAEQAAEPIPGPTTNLLAEKARRLHSWVAMSLHERDGRDVFNTAVLVDREGRIAAKYRKIHLTLDEFERGITPGGDYTVVDTDFAKVGLLVCWDHWFPEAARILRLKGAELLLLPIAGDGESHWDVVSRARAIDNGVYIASAIAAGKPASRIVSPEGEVLAETTGGYAAADLDFNRETRVEWLSVGPAEGEAKSLYIKERRPDTYGPLLPDRDGGR